MNCNLKPLFARVLLRREKFASRSGSIIIPDEAAKRNAPTKAVVVACGPNADKSIQPGMTVILGQYAGAWVNAEGTVVTRPEDAEFFVCLDEDIIAEVKSDE